MNLFWTDEVNTPLNNTRSTHATSRINEIGDCAEVTFDWRHAMTTAVERKHQKRRSITFLCSLCYKTYTKPSQRMNENDVKIRDEFDFSVVHWSMNAKLTWHPGRYLLCTRPIAFLIQCYVLPRTQFYVTWKSETQTRSIGNILIACVQICQNAGFYFSSTA